MKAFGRYFGSAGKYWYACRRQNLPWYGHSSVIRGWLNAWSDS
jgi:hypothetical protein